MEAFAPHPINLFADPNDNDNSHSTATANSRHMDETAYLSLSQFDFELQQQAQAALLQQDVWQDFDKYLPMDNQLLNPINTNFPATNTTTNTSYGTQNMLLRNREAEPIFATPSTATPATASTAQSSNSSNYFNVASSALVYEPLSELLSSNSQQQPIVASQQPPSMLSPNSNFINNNIATTSATTSTLSAHIPNWNGKKTDNSNFKSEYASPESLPYSPPQHIQTAMSLSPPLSHAQQSQPSSFIQFPDLTSPILDATNKPAIAISTADATTMASNTSVSAVSTLPAANWHPSVTVTPSVEGTQAKLPIQRLKSTTNNASNVHGVGGSSNLGSSSNQPPIGRQQKKTAHNAIERRYRNNINDRIAELKNAVPALLYAKVKDNRSANNSNKRLHKANDDDEDDGEDGEEYLDGVAVATKLNKATILRKATEYILHLKKTSEDVRRENQTLQQILTQLPGGGEVLKQYLAQKEQREKIQQQQQQQLLERESLKRLHQRNGKAAASRKRTKYSSQHASRDQEDYDSASSGSSSSPQTPPLASNISNRVFMALFMCITFFSTSPLTTGGSSYTEQYENHHHASKASSIHNNLSNSDNNKQSSVTGNFNATQVESVQGFPSSVLGAFFNVDDRWSMLRNVVFTICIIHVFYPYIRSLIQSSLRLKRVHRSKYGAGAKKFKRGERAAGGHFDGQATSAGQIKIEKIHSILVKSLNSVGDLVFDRLSPLSAAKSTTRNSGSSMFIPLLKELFLIMCHHLLGFDIMLSQQRNNSNETLEEAWNRACLWIKLNELKCVGGSSRLSMLYSCCRMINLVDTLDVDDVDAMDVDENVVAQLCCRAYTTAALQISLIIPNQYLAQRLSRYFWACAVNNSKYYDGHRSDNDMLLELLADRSHEDAMTEESDMWMQSFSWIDPDLYIQDGDGVVNGIYESQAWREACKIMQNTVDWRVVASGKPTSAVITATNITLSLSYNAPVIVPMAILSNLHLLDNLRIQYDKLVATFACQDDDEDGENDQDGLNNSNTAFLDIILLTEGSDAGTENSLRLVNWLATVGLITECLWRDELDEAEKYLPSLIQRIPRSLTCIASSNAQKEVASQLDETVKKFIVHVLAGSTLLRNTSDQQKQKQGLEELQHAEALRIPIRKLQAKLRFLTDSSKVGDGAYNSNYDSLENTVMTQAEFVVSYISLESWINALHLLRSNNDGSPTMDKAAYYEEQINETTLYLRRLTGSAALQNVDEIDSVIDRLSNLNRFMSYLGDADSACDLSDDAEEDDFDIEDELFDVDDNDLLGTLPKNTPKSKHDVQSPTKIAEKAQLILRGHL